ncbi:hypothetical protein KR222_009648, partial [Zaprionus bogoriensis]
NLTCHLLNGVSKFLRLAPLKVELLSLKPYVALYHDVIYDTQINELLDTKKSSELSEWHRDSLKMKSVINKKLIYRVMDMTGMILREDSEFLLMNYGLSGKITIHHNESQSQPELSNRTTSLNDVTQGGATLLHTLNISVQPKKGAALLWHNSKNPLESEQNFDHVSCPIMYGSK